MNIYEEIQKCFPGKSVSLHFVHNKDKSITTLIEPKITDDDEKFNHPVTFTTTPEENPNDLLKEAFEKISQSTIPGILGGDKIGGIAEAEKQIDEEEGGSKKKSSKSKKKSSPKKAKPAKKAAVKKPVAKKPVVVKKKEDKPKVEKVKKVAVVKPSKEELARVAKIDNAFVKFNDSITKKDKTLAKFWYDEIGKLLSDFDNRYDNQLVQAEKDYSTLMELEAPKEVDIKTETKIVDNEYNKPIVNLENPVKIEELQQHNAGDLVDENFEEKKEEKTDLSKDSDDLPMPN